MSNFIGIGVLSHKTIQILNKKDILTDFTIHLLLQGDEFRNDELMFFDTRPENKVSYDEYLKSVNNLVNVEDYIGDCNLDEALGEVKDLKDILTEKEIEYLQDYVYTEFRFGYPDEVDEDGFVWGETYNLNLTIHEIKSIFRDYLLLRKLNSNQYITYYQQFLENLYRQSKKTIEMTKSEIDNFYNNKTSISTVLYSDLTDELKTQLKSDLLKSAKSTSFQIQGGFDEYGFVFNHDDTLNAFIKSHSSKFFNVDFQVDPKHYYALANYEYYLFKIEGKQNVTKTEEQKILKEAFEALKKKHKNQIQFLREKGFDNREINIILNCFSLNKFNIPDMRYIREPMKVHFFCLFFLFYRFEYLSQEHNLKFDIEADFKNTPLIGTIDKNMYFKYFKHSKDPISPVISPHPDYPFKRLTKLLKDIKSELHIDINKLNIPSHLKNKFQ